MAAVGSAALSAEERFSSGKSEYTAKDIAVLEGIQAIRHRPGMYIGSTSTSGMVHLLWEALDNAVDEAVAGYGQQIWVDVDRDGIVRVLDEGRGMPFDLMTYQGKKLSVATVLLTVPHSGGKFAEGAYKTAGGLHGVGATVINALSEWLELDIWRDGQHFAQRFERGKPLPSKIESADPKKHGTQLRWRFDAQIFDHDAYYPRETLERRLQAAAHLNRGLALHLSMWDDEQEIVVTKTFHSKEGLADFVRTATPPGTEPLVSKPITFSQLREQVHVEVALLPNRGYKLDLHSFANAVRTPEGGVHERGFKAALTRVCNDYAAKLGVIKNRDKEAFRPEVIQQGLVAAISVKLKDPQFEGQTKSKLNKEYALLASVIATGVRGAFKIEKCRYSKIIIMTDADVDGGHIRALLLALFYQEMSGLIESGRVFVAMPPLYSVKWKSKTTWLFDDEALRRFMSRNPEAKNAPIKRYKGLGEMTASELRETTMHPASRILKQVTLEDSAIAAQVVTDLMDESRPEARREFLAQAARLTDLDV